jgi:hypothetical protein
LSFDFERGTVGRNRLSGDSRCQICLPKSRPQNTISHDSSGILSHLDYLID